MDNEILVSYNGKSKKVKIEPNDIVTDNTLRGAFFLKEGTAVALCENGAHLTRRTKGQDYQFLLGDKWRNAAFTLEVDENQTSIQSTLNETDSPKPKKRKLVDEELEEAVITDIVSRIREYGIYYFGKDRMKCCAVPLTKNLIATYRHGDNKKFTIGDPIEIHFVSNEKKMVKTRVAKILEDFDVMILKCDQNVIETDLMYDAPLPLEGTAYLMMGFSVNHDGTNHQSFSTGIVASAIQKGIRFLGTSGSYPGDSGAGCWTRDGRILGMQISVVKVPHSSIPASASDHSGNQKSRPASPASGGRCFIISINHLVVLIQDLLPPERHVELEE